MIFIDNQKSGVILDDVPSLKQLVESGYCKKDAELVVKFILECKERDRQKEGL